MQRRIASILVVLFMLLCVLPAFAETQSVTSAFYEAPILNVCTEYSMDMDDDWFDAPSSQYNHKLAQLSICLTTSAFRKHGEDYAHSDENLKTFFKEAGFTGYESYGYYKKPEMDTISNGIAYRDMSDSEGDYVLIAVPVCGQGYGDEWLSNFTVGSTDEHVGFEESAEKVFVRLLEYIDINFPRERIKIWVTGFSRAAAVSNVLGNLILSSGLFESDNIFVYTFGTPNTTKSPVAWPQIFNFCNGFDAVPKVPFADWGYGKHGTTFYLPTRASTPDYDALADSARAIFNDIGGTDTGFDSSCQRNWLLCKILSLLHEFMPESSVYSDGYQAGLIAAWKTEGTIADKVNALIDTAAANGCDTSGLANVKGDLLTLLHSSLNYAAGVVSKKQSDTTWIDTLSDAKSLVHEHSPLVYIAWLFSDADGSQVLATDSRYQKLILSGEFDVQIYRINPESGEEIAVYDLSKGITNASVVSFEKETFVDLPFSENYELVLTVKKQSEAQLQFATATLTEVDPTMIMTPAMTMYPDETVTVFVAADTEGEDAVWAIMNDNVELPFGDTSDEITDLTKQGFIGREGAFDELFTDAIIMIPYLGSLLAMALYAAIALIKRLVRKQANDAVDCGKAGRILFLCAAALSAAAFGYNIFTLIRYCTAEHIALENRMLQRISEYIGMGATYFIAYNCLLYGLMALFGYRSIRHSRSRRHLTYLSILVFILNIFSMNLSLDLNTFIGTTLLYQLMPASAVVALIVAAESDRKKLGDRKRHRSTVIAIVFTVMLFVIYQIKIALQDGVEESVSFTKVLNSLPVLLLALQVYVRRGTKLRLCTFIAIFGYMLANVLINASKLAGICIYTAAHAVMLFGYLKSGKPARFKFVLWIALTFVCAVELFLLRGILPNAFINMGFLYVAVQCATVTASLSATHCMRAGSILFLVSNELLVLTFVYPNSFTLSTMELLLFYIAVMLLAIDSDRSPEISEKEA